MVLLPTTPTLLLVSRHSALFLLIMMLFPQSATAQVQNAHAPCSKGTPLKSQSLYENLGEFCKMKDGGMDGRIMIDNNGKIDCLYCCANHYWDAESKSCMQCPKGTFSKPGPNTHCIPIDGDESADPRLNISILSTPTISGITSKNASQNAQSMNSIPSKYEVMPTTQSKDLDPATLVTMTTVTSRHPDNQGTTPDQLNRDQNALPIILGVIGGGVVVVVLLVLALIIYFKRKSKSSRQGYQRGREQAGGDCSSSADSSSTSVGSAV